VDRAGGVSAIIRAIYAVKGLIHGDCLTVNGKTIAQNVARAKVRDTSVIRPLDNPYSTDGGLVPPMAKAGDGHHFHVTGLTHDEAGRPRTDSAEAQRKLVQRLCDKIRKNVDKIIKVDRAMLEDADVAVVSYGITSRAALSAVRKARQEGIKAGLLRLVTIWPFPDKQVAELAKQCKALVVPEMNYGQLVREVERAAKETPVKFLPKLGEEPHKPAEILDALRRAHK
jgi:2-oxoglutarate ferredoxin oxidoreductase subunit alpha